MQKLLYITIILLISALLFGCTDPEQVLREKQVMKDFFTEYPELELQSITRLHETEFELEKEQWEEDCNLGIEVGQYYKTIYSDGEVTLEVLAEASKLNIVCIVIETPPVPETNPNQAMNEITDCGTDLDCFIELSKTCSKGIWTSDYNTRFEITGIFDGNCVVYRELMDDLCPFRIENLTAMLERWKLNQYSTNDWITCETQWVEIDEPGEDEVCVENWVCSPWGNCIDGQAVRTCIDMAQCGTVEDRPEEIATCFIEVEIETTMDMNNFSAEWETYSQYLQYIESEDIDDLQLISYGDVGECFEFYDETTCWALMKSMQELIGTPSVEDINYVWKDSKQTILATDIVETIVDGYPSYKRNYLFFVRYPDNRVILLKLIGQSKSNNSPINFPNYSDKTDSDGDGWWDITEEYAETNPEDANDYPFKEIFIGIL